MARFDYQIQIKQDNKNNDNNKNDNRDNSSTL